MKQKSGPGKAPAEQVLKDVRRQTRRQYSAEENIRIVLEGCAAKRTSRSFAAAEGIAASMPNPIALDLLGKAISGGITYPPRAVA